MTFGEVHAAAKEAGTPERLETVVEALTRMLAEQGYVARRPEVLALAGMLKAGSGQGAKAVLLGGPPGCGKTEFAESVGRISGGSYLYGMMHAWTDDQELFCGVDVASAVAGEADHVRQDGVLARAARLSQKAAHSNPVVICLDEIDKTPERGEMLLLDWLQTGRVPIQPGTHLTTRLEHCLIFLTTNEMRPMSDALLRRVRRVWMDPLPDRVVHQLVLERAKKGAELTAPIQLLTPTTVQSIHEALKAVSANEANYNLSLQEVARAVKEVFLLAETAADVRLILSGWGTRTEIGYRSATQKSSEAGLTPKFSAAWEKIKAAREAGEPKAPPSEPTTKKEGEGDGSK